MKQRRWSQQAVGSGTRAALHIVNTHVNPAAVGGALVPTARIGSPCSADKQLDTRMI